MNRRLASSTSARPSASWVMIQAIDSRGMRALFSEYGGLWLTVTGGLGDNRMMHLYRESFALIVDGVDPLADSLLALVIDDRGGADGVGAGTVEVHRLPPGGPVAVGEVGAEGAQVVPVRAQVVVHDVEDHTDSGRVRSIDEAAEIVRFPVVMVRGEEVDSVVPPAEAAGELRYRHHLDRGHPQGGELVELRGGRAPRSL